MANIREDMQRWLDAYKRGIETDVDNAVIATAFAEFLQETKTDTRIVSHIEELEHRAKELEHQVKELKFQLDGARMHTTRLEGENSALRFAIRCNGVSGAEVAE